LDIDRDKNGTIDFDEFLIGIRGDMNPRRTAMVDMVFDMLDTDHSGEISIDEMIDRYDFTSHPEVKNGTKTARDCMKEFIKQWDRFDSDGKVSREEFHDYYKGISASIDGDDYFELMIRNAWRIAGGEGAAANTANRRVLVTKADGRQEVVTINNELGMKVNKKGGAGGGGYDMEDVKRRLGQQGVDLNGADVGLFGGYDDTGGGGGGRNNRPPNRGNNNNNPNNRSRTPNNQRPSNSNNRPSSVSRQRPSSNNNNHNNTGNRILGGMIDDSNQNSTIPMFQKHAAAAKLAAAYRGRLARKQVEQEKRKLNAQTQRKQEEQIEANRPKPREILRPKAKSYIGF
jgi:hypothetical protein